MVPIGSGTTEELEALAAWHRANAEHAGSEWVWEARLRTAEDLERQVAELRARRDADKGHGEARAYSHHGHGSRADQHARYMAATSDCTPSFAKCSRGK